MATRSATRLSASASSSPAPARRPPPIAQPASSASPQLLELRRQWKWAAFSQFFTTFAQLIALEDVSLVDIENDLVNSTMIVMPRVMQRLLVTLSQDRKITVSNWQTSLRRQYLRRDPAANPIGFEPVVSRNSRAATVEAEIKSEEPDAVLADESASKELHDGAVSSDDDPKPEATAGVAVEEKHDLEKDKLETDPSLHENEETMSDEKDTTAQDAPGSLKDWADLSMLEKLDSIHTLTEWHFQSPLRLRSIMRSDDENASWRIEPVGYDSKKNAYWFIGLDRLWIQRSPPRAPRNSAKRKAVSNADKRRAKAARTDRGSTARRTKEKKESQEVEVSHRDTTHMRSTPQRSRRTSRRPAPVDDIPPESPRTGGRARAAKTQANAKLDLQAKQLAAAKAELQSYNRRQSEKRSPVKSSNRQTVGIRLSRRLRGVENEEDDEWQPIPEEWLPNGEGPRKSSASLANGVATRTSPRKRPNLRPSRGEFAAVPVRSHTNPRIAGLDDDESDLTELSDSEPSTPEDDDSCVKGRSDRVEATPEAEDNVDDEQPTVEVQETPGFIEWETICVSLDEWEEIAHRFEKATHYLEKALHKVLVQEIVPFVTANLREIEMQRIKEEALMNRKRSSRIAIKESEKEAERLAAVRQAEEEEKMARMRRLEARNRREEEERLKREQAREQRRKEREERELARSRRLERSSEEVDIDSSPQVWANATATPNHDTSSNGPTKSPRRRKEKQTGKKSASSDRWELDCEICGARGINRDDGVALMSCGKCSKWQHIPCHDAVDKKAGRPLRNWDDVDFFCKRCLATQNSHTNRTSNGTNGREHHPYSHIGTSRHVNGPTRNINNNGTINFAGFAHYHPQQRGFSPHPSVNQPHLHGPSAPTQHSQVPAARVIPYPWTNQTQPGSFASGGSSQDSSFPGSVIPQSQRSNGVPPENRQSYGVPSPSNLMTPSAQTVPYPHAYYLSSQHSPYSNPTSFQR